MLMDLLGKLKDDFDQVSRLEQQLKGTIGKVEPLRKEYIELLFSDKFFGNEAFMQAYSYLGSLRINRGESFSEFIFPAASFKSADKSKNIPEETFNFSESKYFAAISTGSPTPSILKNELCLPYNYELKLGKLLVLDKITKNVRFFLYGNVTYDTFYNNFSPSIEKYLKSKSLFNISDNIQLIYFEENFTIKEIKQSDLVKVLDHPDGDYFPLLYNAIQSMTQKVIGEIEKTITFINGRDAGLQTQLKELSSSLKKMKKLV